MQRRRDDIEGKRPRITVSLDPEDLDYVQTFEGSSDSYKIAKIIKAARTAGITGDGVASGGTIPELVQWLSGKRSKLAKDLRVLLNEFLEDNPGA